MSALFEDLVRRSLGDVATDVKKKLLQELNSLGSDFIAPQVADAVSRTVIKSLDGVVAAAVKRLSQEEAERLAAAYLAEVGSQLDDFDEALIEYLPHAIEVETAKRKFGDKSTQANLARAQRLAFIGGVKSEVRDVFLAVAGKEPTD